MGSSCCAGSHMLTHIQDAIRLLTCFGSLLMLLLLQTILFFVSCSLNLLIVMRSEEPIVRWKDEREIFTMQFWFFLPLPSLLFHLVFNNPDLCNIFSYTFASMIITIFFFVFLSLNCGPIICLLAHVSQSASHSVTQSVTYFCFYIALNYSFFYWIFEKLFMVTFFPVF